MPVYLALIPAYNEQDHISTVVTRARAHLPEVTPERNRQGMQALR